MNSLPFYLNNDYGMTQVQTMVPSITDDSLCLDNNNNDLSSQLDPDLNYNAKYPQNECKYYTIDEFNNNVDISEKLSIFHSNIRSSQAHINDIECYVENLNVQFSFIGFSETWETEMSINNMPGYNRYSCIRPHKRRGGGVSLYIKQNIPFKIREDLEFYNKTLKKT